MTKCSALFLSFLTLVACGDGSQEVAVEVKVAVSDEAVEAVRAWPAALVATVTYDQQLTPDSRERSEAASEVIAVFCGPDDVQEVSNVVEAALGPCREGVVLVEVALAPLGAGSDCEGPPGAVATLAPDVRVEVEALELDDRCGSFDAAVDVAL